MINKKKFIFLMIFMLIILSNSFSSEIRVQRPQREKKVFKEHFFQIIEPENWQYSLNDTSEMSVKAHRWINENKDYILEIRVAEYFVHLNFYALRDFFIENTKDLFSNLKLKSEKQQKLIDRWIWHVEFSGQMADNKKVKIRLFIVTNRQFVYFISVIYPEDKQIIVDIINAINSINYL